jgi:hypothetical protein
MKNMLSSKEEVCDSPPISIPKSKKIRKGIKYDHTVIKCKLMTILKDKQWLPEIKKMVNYINMIKTEAYFFFNQFILAQLSSDDSTNNLCLQKFDYSTIERCALFVLGKSDMIRHKDVEYNALINVYEKEYLPLGNNEIQILGNEKSITQPFTYISREIMINIINHTNLNFKKFQRLYVRTFVFDIFIEFKLKKPILILLLNCILYHINNKINNLTILSKKLLKLPNIDNIIPIMIDIINQMKKEIPKSIYENISKDNLKKNYVDVLKYYYMIIKYLENNNRKRFSLLPQLKLGNNYVKFDSRFISTFYDKYNKYNEAKIKKFAKLYKEYYKKCFNFDIFNRKLLKNNWNPISIVTNGYSVCVIFEKEKTEDKSRFKKLSYPKTEKQSDDDDTKKSPKKQLINLRNELANKKFKKGLYDAKECDIDESFLNEFHIMGIDPGNKILLYVVSESGKRIKITKNYYNEISHINRNNKKMKSRIKSFRLQKGGYMTEVYKQLSDTKYKKTININNYNNFIKIMRGNWTDIWNFYSQKCIQKYELDTYINKKKAIQKIVRKIIPKSKKKHKYNKYKSKYIDEKKAKELEKKPVMIAFGKGNGSITINNLKNSGPKGPIKTLANELSKVGLVCLTDEYNSSQMCPIHKNHKIKHNKRKINQNKKDKKSKIEETKCELTYEIKKDYRLCFCEIKKEHPSLREPSLCEISNEENFSNHENREKDIHKLWFNRDFVGGLNLITILRLTLTGKELGEYKRKKISKKISKKKSKSWSQNINVNAEELLDNQLSIKKKDNSLVEKKIIDLVEEKEKDKLHDPNNNNMVDQRKNSRFHDSEKDLIDLINSIKSKINWSIDQSDNEEGIRKKLSEAPKTIKNKGKITIISKSNKKTGVKSDDICEKMKTKMKTKIENKHINQ